jgi:hypothetical protein
MDLNQFDRRQDAYRHYNGAQHPYSSATPGARHGQGLRRGQGSRPAYGQNERATPSHQASGYGVSRRAHHAPDWSVRQQSTSGAPPTFHGPGYGHYVGTRLQPTRGTSRQSPSHVEFSQAAHGVTETSRANSRASPSRSFGADYADDSSSDDGYIIGDPIPGYPEPTSESEARAKKEFEEDKKVFEETGHWPDSFESEEPFDWKKGKTKEEINELDEMWLDAYVGDERIYDYRKKQTPD